MTYYVSSGTLNLAQLNSTQLNVRKSVLNLLKAELINFWGGGG